MAVAAAPAEQGVLAPDGISLTPSGPDRPERLALRAMQIGALAVVLAVSTDKAFELDRFFVPKELALHLTALAAGVLAALAFRRVALSRVDLFLIGYLVLSAISAVTAEDGALAARALAVSVSGVAIFWTARALREAGLSRPLLVALAVAVVVGTATSLLQTYGTEPAVFSVNRAPGGILGNRNFIAHLAAFGLPVTLLAALRAWRVAGYMMGAVGVVLVVASLVLTRSRAGWLAFGAVLLVFLVAMLASRPLRRHPRTWARLVGILALAGAGVAAAILLPNSLQWRSENPYLESMRTMASYEEGSGRGRLVQYRQSMRIAAGHPLLGVGPGNWPVHYPDYAAPGDPSLSRSRPGTTANPWPSSDWIAFVSERGVPATFLLALALLGLAGSAWRRLRGARDADEGLAAAAMLATLAATAVAGAFDAVLLLATPTLIVWAALGALWSPLPAAGRPGPRPVQVIALTALALAAGMGAVASAARLLEIIR